MHKNHSPTLFRRSPKKIDKNSPSRIVFLTLRPVFLWLFLSVHFFFMAKYLSWFSM